MLKLLEAGAVSESDADGWTPLHFAAEVSQVHPCLQSAFLYFPLSPTEEGSGIRAFRSQRACMYSAALHGECRVRLSSAVRATA